MSGGWTPQDSDEQVWQEQTPDKTGTNPPVPETDPEPSEWQTQTPQVSTVEAAPSDDFYTWQAQPPEASNELPPFPEEDLNPSDWVRQTDGSTSMTELEYQATIDAAGYAAEAKAYRDETKMWAEAGSTEYADIVVRHEDIIVRHDDIIVRHDDIIARQDDVIERQADVTAKQAQTTADAAATAADRVQTGLDAAATAADRVQTGQDRVATGQDRAAVAADRVLAETARVGAETARTGAEAARDEATTQAGYAESYAESAYSNRISSEAARDAAIAARDSAQGYATTAQSAMAQTLIYRNEAEAFRDETADLVEEADFANYYNKAEADARYYNKTEIDTTFGDYYTKTQIDTNIYTKAQVDDTVVKKPPGGNVLTLRWDTNTIILKVDDTDMTVLRSSNTQNAVLRDLTVQRDNAPATGAVFFGNSGGKYIFWDGDSFELGGGGSIQPGGWILASNGNLYMPWAGDYLSNLLGAKFNTSGGTFTGAVALQSGSYTVGPSTSVTHGFYAYNTAQYWGYIGFPGTTDFYVVGTYSSLIFCPANAGKFAMSPDRFRPVGNNICYLGDTSNRWIAVYAVNGTIQTSDETKKTNIRPANEAEIRVGRKLRKLGVLFQWKDKVAEEGEDVARLHSGMIAQRVEQAFRDEGLDPARYSLWCADPETKKAGPEGSTEIDGEYYLSVPNEETGVIELHKVAPIDVPTGNTIYSIRYDELHSFIMATISAEMDQINEKVNPKHTRYSKAQLFDAMTDEEFTKYEQVRTTQNKRERAVFDNATEIAETHPLAAKFKQLLMGAYGSTRGAELLEASKIK